MSFIGLFELLFLAGFIAAIILAVKYKPVRGVLIGLLIACPILLMLFYLLFSARSVSRTPVPESLPDAAWVAPHEAITGDSPAQPLFATAQSASHTWPEAPGLADVYPSRTSATEGIAKWVAKAINESLRESRDPIALQVTGNVEKPWLESLAAAINQRTPAVRARYTDRPVQHGNSANALLTIKDVSPEEGGQTTALSVDLTRGEDARRAWVSYNDQPWVENPAQEESRSGWTIGYSVELHPEEKLAEQQALHQAIDKLADRAAATRGSRQFTSYDTELKLDHDHGWYREEIERRLRSGAWPQFYFIQKFDQPYGAVYRAAVVVSTERDDHLEVAQAAWDNYQASQAHAEGRQHHQRSKFVGGIAFVACVALIYTVLNVVTKGYYLWSLRTMAILLAAGGVLLLILLA